MTDYQIDKNKCTWVTWFSNHNVQLGRSHPLFPSTRSDPKSAIVCTYKTWRLPWSKVLVHGRKKTSLRVPSHEWAKPKPKLLKMDSITIPNKMNRFKNMFWQLQLAQTHRQLPANDVEAERPCAHDPLVPRAVVTNPSGCKYTTWKVNGTHLHWTSLDFAFWHWLKPIIWQNLIWAQSHVEWLVFLSPSPTFWGGIMPSCRHSVIYLLGSGYLLPWCSTDCLGIHISETSWYIRSKARHASQ